MIPWRVIQNGRIAYANSDDGQKFGLPTPIDGETEVNRLFAGKRVQKVTVDRVTADIHVDFDSEMRLDLFNDSSGYEGWQGSFRTQDHDMMIVGLPGGDVGIWRVPKRDS